MLVDGTSVTVVDSYSEFSRFEIHDMFMFQNIYYHVFSFFLLLIPKRLNNACAWRIMLQVGIAGM